MADLLRMRKVTVRVDERDIPFAVQIALSDGSFECALGAINAWHHYHGNPRRHRRHYAGGEQEFWNWCGLRIAKAVRHRVRGEILPAAVRLPTERRPGRVSRTTAARNSGAPTIAKTRGVASR